MRFFKSAAFRLTLLYVIIFGASVSVLLDYIHDSNVKELESQIKHSVNIQLADLGRKFILDGTGDTISAINHLMQTDKQGMFIFMLINTQADWKVVAGNRDEWPGGSPKRRDWIRFNLTEPTAEKPRPPQAIAINSSLPRGYILLVGHKLTSIEKFEKNMRRIIIWCMAVALLLGIVGGLLLTYIINKRLEKVNNACERVMQGELKHRVDVDGAGDEFDHLGKNFNAMLSRIEELIDGIRDISASVAHDLRTPLNRVRNRLEKLEQGSLDIIAVQEEIRAAIFDLDRLVATFNSILRISQAEAGAGREGFVMFDLSSAITDIADLYTPLAEEKGISMQMDIARDIELLGDRHLLSQAVANLVDNAIKYSPVGAEVSISLHADEKQAILQVKDTGPGIPQEYFGKVVEKFFRMESSRSAPGNGLGLSLANAAFGLHGAMLAFSDNQPGLCVEVTFPRSLT